MKVIRTALPPGLLSQSHRRVRLAGDASVEKTDRLSISPTLLEVALQLIAVLHKSPQQDYSWQYVQRQLKFLRRPAREVEQALRALNLAGAG